MSVPFSMVKSSGRMVKFCTCCALEMALSLAFLMPYDMILRSLSFFLASATVLAGAPWSVRSCLVMLSSFPERGGSSLRVMKQVRYFRVSPMIMTLARKGRAARI